MTEISINKQARLSEHFTPAEMCKTSARTPDGNILKYCGLLLAMLVELAEEVVEGLKAEKDEESAGGGQDIHADTTGQTDGGYDPQTCGSGETADHVLLLTEDDGTSTNETDAAYDLGSDTGDIPARRHVIHLEFIETVGRDYHEQCRAKGNEEMGAETSLLGSVFTFKTDETAKQSSNENS